MTTLVRTRMPLETLSMTQQPVGRRRSKRLAAYDEEDGDFVFTRGSKRTKMAEMEPKPVPAPAIPPTTKRGRVPKDRSDEMDSAEDKSQGREMESPMLKHDTERIPMPKKRDTARSSTRKAQNGLASINPSMAGTTEHDSIDMLQSAKPHRTPTLGTEGSSQSRMISLPFSDTPVLDRNKEIRKKGTGSRRSSLGLRGRRASSLIDHGHSAIPHREVEASEFYKHIEADGLSEPRRMKQLLTWTGERELGVKPSHGEANDLSEQAARTIKEGLLRDFTNRPEYSDWFSREETAPRKVIKKPNPRNIELEENIIASETRIKLLQQERDHWKALSKCASSLPPITYKEFTELTPSHIDASLLSAEQSSILTTLAAAPASDLRSQVSKQAQDFLTGLEFKVDKFADGTHKLEQYQQTAGRAANKILLLSTVRLEERHRREKESVGTRDLPMQEVLRSLSRIVPEGSRRGR